MSGGTAVSEENQESYDLFISYRSAKSGRHATALRRALYAFDKRHANVGLRIFLDRISLKNGPLSKHIEEGLRRSRCLVVLVDSTTRESPWVDTEITTWLEKGGSAEKLFLIKTDQVDLTWDEGKKDFRSPEQLPPALCGLFKDEQKFTDFLVPPRRVKDIDLVPLYSAITEQDPDGLEVDEKQYRARQRARSRLLVAVLCTLLVGAIIMAIIAAQNAIRANEASRQARADALAAEALLTLPVSPERAMSMGIQAGKLNDSASIRSALIEIAAGTGQLTGTMSLTEETDATSLTGLSFDPDGRYLTAWGPGTTEGRTVVATWLNISGDLMRSFEIEGNIQTLIEVPGQSYLACTETKAMEIDLYSHDVTVLGEGAEAGCLFDTSTAGMVIMSVTITDNSKYDMLHVRTLAGKKYELHGKVATSTPNSIHKFIHLDDDPGAVETERILVATPEGLSEEVKIIGSKVYEDPTALTFRLNDGSYAALSLKDGKPAVMTLTVPQDAQSVVSWTDNEGELRWFWVTNAGMVGTSLSDDSVSLGSIGNDDVKEIYHFGYNKVLIASERVFSRVLLDDSGRLSIAETERLVHNSLFTPSTCGRDSIIFGEEYVLETEDKKLSSHRGKSDFRGCELVKFGSPVMVNGETIISRGIASPNLTAVGAAGYLAIGRTDGVIGRYSIGSRVFPWRPNHKPSVIVSRDGTSQLWNGSSQQSPRIVVDGEERTLVSTDFGQWVLPRPDGLGGVISYEGGSWAVEGGGMPVKLTDSPRFASYRPREGFESDRSAAEAQQLVCEYQNSPTETVYSDCLTGNFLEEHGKILEYKIGPSLGRIIAFNDGKISVTTWKVYDSDSRPVTHYFNLPSMTPDVAAISLDESLVVVASTSRSEILEYRLENGEWVVNGEGYSLEHDGVSFVSYSPDSSLLLAVTKDGEFELFDVRTKRRLATSSFGISAKFFGVREFQYMSVIERDGYLVTTLSSLDGSASLTIPTSTEVLVNLLCGVRKTEECGS